MGLSTTRTIRLQGKGGLCDSGRRRSRYGQWAIRLGLEMDDLNRLYEREVSRKAARYRKNGMEKQCR